MNTFLIIAGVWAVLVIPMSWIGLLFSRNDTSAQLDRRYAAAGIFGVLWPAMLLVMVLASVVQFVRLAWKAHR